jgi:hypothetical protein
MIYEVEFRAVKKIEINAENDYDCDNKARKIAKTINMEVWDYWLQDGQMPPDKYTKPEIHTAFDTAIDFTQNIHKIWR